jgi:hypothetical protein
LPIKAKKERLKRAALFLRGGFSFGRLSWRPLSFLAHQVPRLHDAKREVIIYDYVDMSVPVLARMAAKRRVGYQTIGYRILGTGDLFADQSVASEAVGEAPATFSV